MQPNKKLSAFAISIILQLACATSYAANDEDLAKQAIETFNQRKADVKKLREAARTGDHEAQFYLAETLTTDSGHMTPEARSWYERSAEQSDMYSMYRLSKQGEDICNIMENCPSNAISPKNWGTTLLKIAGEKAQRGDGEGMEMMYIITGDLNWLVKSAAAGYPSAQCWLAMKYGDGEGLFFWPGHRKDEIERLYKASAESGYPKSINEYAAILFLKGDIKGAQEWLLKGVSIGYAIAIGSYAYNLEHGEPYHFKKDLQLSYSLNLLLSELGGGESDTSAYSLEKIKPQLTSAQISAAEQQAIEWKATHPTISYYPPKLEIY